LRRAIDREGVRRVLPNLFGRFVVRDHGDDRRECAEQRELGTTQRECGLVVELELLRERALRVDADEADVSVEHVDYMGLAR
jgi:hypothetical protein